MVDAGTEEGRIRDPVVQGLPGAFPNAVSLYVEPDEIPIGMQFCQAHGVLTLSAGQFEGYRMHILEMVSCPLAFEGEIMGRVGIGHLHAVREPGHIGKPGQLVRKVRLS